jgi:hypothetical protein
VAAAIEHHSAGSLDENAAMIAEHLEAAGDLHAAFDWHMRAGAWSNNRDLVAARVSWEGARQVADALPDEDPRRTAMRIASRTALCATDWRVHASDESDVRFEELRELCALVGDKTSLAFGIMGPIAGHHQRGEAREAQRLASELMALLDSIGDPALTAQAAFGAVGIKAQAGAMSEVLRWAQAAIEWADGDPAKGGNLIAGSPLAVALALRGLAGSWFGRSGWREDLDDAIALAEQSADSLTLAVVVSWAYGMGTWNGAVLADDAVVRTIESALHTAEASGDDYAVILVKWLLGSMLLIRRADGDRHRGLELVALVRDVWLQQRYQLAELPILDLYVGQDMARGGDRDEAIQVIRKSVDDIRDRGQVGYSIPATGILVEALLERGGDGDSAEAEAAIARLAAEPAEGSVLLEVWLLRMRALLARARGDGTAYADFRDRYRDMAKTLGYEGHIAWAEAMP